MKAAIALAFIPFSGTAFAQGFDILRQDVIVDVSSSTVTTIHSTAELAAEGSTTELVLFAPALPIASFAIDGVPATSRPHPQYPDLVEIVELPRAFEDGEPFTLDVHSEGALSCGSVLQPGTLACMRNADLTILVPASPDVGWYVLNLLALDPFVGSVTVRAPSGFEIAAGQGDPISVEEIGGIATARFDFARPTENLAVYAGRAERVEAPGVLGLYTGDHREKMQRAVDLAAEILPQYGERFGVLPVDRTRIVSIPRGFPFGGIGLIGTVLFGDYVVGELDYLLEQGTAHEVAHTWWGGLAGSADPSSAGFFNEAFAEWSARWALGRVRGETERTSGDRMNAVWYMYARPNDADVAVLDPAVGESPLYVFVTYHKASVVLRTIEAAMGEAAFTEVLRSMIARGPGGTDIGTFVDDLAGAGYDASRDVREWLESTGFPRVSISVEGNVALTAEVEGEFHFDLPVRAFASDGTSTDSRLPLAPGSTSHPIDGAPVLIQLDPEWTSVREIRPAVAGDVSFDGAVDGIDLIEVALRAGAHLPAERRVDGSYDPLYDLNGDRRTDDLDLRAITGD
jgi:aminopeptidase N